MISTEARREWYEIGLDRERQFVAEIAPLYGLKAEINPAKSLDPCAPDLMVDGEQADLKSQWTPFYKSWSLAGVLPRYAVTFNVKDQIRYDKLYPRLMLYFWVNWSDSLNYGVRVSEASRVHRIRFNALQGLILRRALRPHRYQRREGDRENANKSYVLDTRWMEELRRLA